MNGSKRVVRYQAGGSVGKAWSSVDAVNNQAKGQPIQREG